MEYMINNKKAIAITVARNNMSACLPHKRPISQSVSLKYPLHVSLPPPPPLAITLWSSEIFSFQIIKKYFLLSCLVLSFISPNSPPPFPKTPLNLFPSDSFSLQTPQLLTINITREKSTRFFANSITPSGLVNKRCNSQQCKALFTLSPSFAPTLSPHLSLLFSFSLPPLLSLVSISISHGM